MVHQLASHWWLFLLRGIVVIVFGIAILLLPDVASYVLVLVIGAFAFFDGALMILAAVRGSHEGGRWIALLVAGLAGLAFGIIIYRQTDAAAYVIAYLFAAWLVVTGIFEIIAAVELRKTIANEWLWILSGILSLGFGAAFAFLPGLGLIALAYMIGIYAIIAGFALVGLSMRLRKHHHTALP